MRYLVGRTLFLASVTAFLVSGCGGGSSDEGHDPLNAPPSGVWLVEVSSAAVGSITASWFAAIDDRTVESAIRYELHASTEPGYTPSVDTLRLASTGALSGVIDAGLQPGALHYVRLVAIDEQGARTTSDALPVRVADTSAVPVPGAVTKVLQAAEQSEVRPDAVVLSAGVAAPAVGSFIASEEGLGYLRRVTGVRAEGASTVVDTVRASLSEVVSNVQISSSVKLKPVPTRTGSSARQRPLGIQTAAGGDVVELLWPQSRFRYSSGAVGAEPERKRAASARRRVASSGETFVIGRTTSVRGDWAGLFAPERIGVDEGARGEALVWVEVNGDGAPMFGSPVSICKVEFGTITNDDPGARPSEMLVAPVGGMEAIEIDPTTDRLKHIRQAFEVVATSKTASMLPYKVKVTAYLEDVDRDCKPPEAFELWSRPLGGWRETIDFELPIFVGNDPLPENEVAEREFEGIAEAEGRFTVSNAAVIGFDPALSYELRLGSVTEGLEYAAVTLEANPMIEQTLTVSATGRGSIDATADLIGARKFYKLFVTASGIPVVISGELTIKLRVEGEVTGALEATENFRVGFDRIAYGIECVGYLECRVTEDTRPVVNLKIGGEGRAQADLKLTLVPSLTLLTYESVSGRVTLEPFMQGTAGIEGKVEYEADFDPDAHVIATAFDADYRLTSSSLQVGLDAYLYADFSAFDKTWLAWPSDAKAADYRTHYRVPVARTTVAELPALSAAVDMMQIHPDDVAAIRIQAQAVDAPNPWKSIFPSMADSLIPWRRWTPTKILAPIGTPEGSYGVVAPIGVEPGENWVTFTKPGTYIVRLGGFSAWGGWARQYIDVAVTVTDANGNGILDHVEARASPDEIAVAGASCTPPVVGEVMTCTLTGSNLPAETAFEASNCSPRPMVPAAGGSADARSYTCTPLSPGVPVEVSYTVPGYTDTLPTVPTLPAEESALPISDIFAWPVDPTNPSRGHQGECADQAAGCYWLSDASRDASTVWRDAQPFQQERNPSYGWHLGADYNLGSGSADHKKKVFAAADGKVAAVHRNVCGYGNVILLRHNTSTGPVVTMYAHVDWFEVKVPEVGDPAERGSPIAEIGDGSWTATDTCGSNGSYKGIEHLHFELRKSSDITVAKAYTAEKLAAGAKGPQGQVDPNAYLRNTLAMAGRLNDTGITADICYRAGSDDLVSCSSAEAIALNAQQDGMVGRDVTANDDSDGKAGFSFSLVPKPGGGFYDKTECVKDNVTGLTWEGKTNNGGLRDGVLTYTNWGDGRAGDASAYVAYVNSIRLCGYTDWRLPDRAELQGIVDYGVSYPGPTIDAAWFPNTRRDWYWTSSPLAGNPGYAWIVSFGYGYVYRNLRINTLRVRLVR